MDVDNLKYYAKTLERHAGETDAAVAAFRASLSSLRGSNNRVEEMWLRETAKDLHDLAQWARQLAAEIKRKIAM